MDDSYGNRPRAALRALAPFASPAGRSVGWENPSLVTSARCTVKELLRLRQARTRRKILHDNRGLKWYKCRPLTPPECQIAPLPPAFHPWEIPMINMPLGLEAPSSCSVLTRRQLLQVGGLSM